MVNLIRITEDEIPPSMRGPFVRTVTRVDANTAFMIRGIDPETGDRLADEIRSRKLESRDGVLQLLAEFGAES